MYFFMQHNIVFCMGNFTAKRKNNSSEKSDNNDKPQEMSSVSVSITTYAGPAIIGSI